MADDIQFQPEYLPDRYQDRVQRAAVLHRLRRRSHSLKQMTAATITLVGAWRFRLHELYDVGWQPAGETATATAQATKWAFMRNCCPTFVYCTPRTATCCVRHLCPFCYARAVGEVFLRLDKAFPNPRQTGPTRRSLTDEPLRRVQITDQPRPAAQFPYHLLERRVKQLLAFMPEPNLDDHDEFTWLQASLGKIIKARRTRIRRVGALGAYSHMTVEPATGGWLISLNELFMVPAGFDHSHVDKPPGGGSVLRRHARPSRKVIYNAVARVCAYPVGLFAGDVGLAMTALHARYKRKLSASFGRLRRP